MDHTFENCASVKEMDLSSFNVPKINSMVNTFKNCRSLELLMMDNFEINSKINTSRIFDSINNEIIYVVNKADNISNIPNNINIINKDSNCSFINNCQDCNKDKVYLCESCTNNYRLSNTKLIY